MAENEFAKLDRVIEDVTQAGFELNTAADWIREAGYSDTELWDSDTVADDLVIAEYRLRTATDTIKLLIEVAKASDAYIRWLADPEGTEGTLPEKCMEGADDCQLCSLQEALEEVGFEYAPEVPLDPEALTDLFTRGVQSTLEDQ